MTALITCYNKLELWIDGMWYGPDNGQWQIAWSFQISTNATLIAVKAVQYGTKGGILGSLSSRLVTDEGWKCTDRFHSNWMALSYDDSAWSRAMTYGYNGVNPWSKVAGIADNANWIWTADNKNDDVIYCRRLLTGKYLSYEPGLLRKRTGITKINVWERKLCSSYLFCRETSFRWPHHSS